MMTHMVEILKWAFLGASLVSGALVILFFYYFIRRDHDDISCITMTALSCAGCLLAASSITPEYADKPDETITDSISRKWTIERGGLFCSGGLRYLVATKSGSFDMPESDWRLVKVGNQVRLHATYSALFGRDLELEY